MHLNLLSEFTHRCVSILEIIGDKASGAKNFDEAVSAYSTALSVDHPSLLTILNKWARIVLQRSSGSEAWGAAAEVRLPSR